MIPKFLMEDPYNTEISPNFDYDLVLLLNSICYITNTTLQIITKT